MDPAFNFANYRTALSKRLASSQPTIPFICKCAAKERRMDVSELPFLLFLFPSALLVRDALFSKEGNDQQLETMKLLLRTVRLVRKCQSMTYSLAISEACRTYFDNAVVVEDEDRLFQMALLRRPSLAEAFNQIEQDAMRSRRNRSRSNSGSTASSMATDPQSSASAKDVTRPSHSIAPSSLDCECEIA
jgi:hypothetical protein